MKANNQKQRCLALRYKLCVICLALFSVLPSKHYCDIIKATLSYLEHKEVRHRY